MFCLCVCVCVRHVLWPTGNPLFGAAPVRHLLKSEFCSCIEAASVTFHTSSRSVNSLDPWLSRTLHWLCIRELAGWSPFNVQCTCFGHLCSHLQLLQSTSAWVQSYSSSVCIVWSAAFYAAISDRSGGTYLETEKFNMKFPNVKSFLTKCENKPFQENVQNFKRRHV